MRVTISFIVVCTILLLIGCKNSKEVYLFTSFHEPATDGLRFLYSHDGINWDSIPGVWLKPEVGKQKVMRDPSIAQTPDGIFHLVWTSSWKGDLGFGYSNSRDLINWSVERIIPVMQHDTTCVNVWAPEIFYDDISDSLMVVWASCVPNKFEKGIEDEYNNHRLYYMMTKDFNSFSETKLFYNPGFSVIDATVLKRGIDDYVMVMKDNTRPKRNLKIAFGKTAKGPWSDASKSFTGFLSEGPSVAKVDSGYIIYFDEYREMIYGASFTKDFVNFKNITDKISVPRGHKHGTILKVSEDIVNKMIKFRITK